MGPERVARHRRIVGIEIPRRDATSFSVSARIWLADSCMAGTIHNISPRVYWYAGGIFRYLFY